MLRTRSHRRGATLLESALVYPVLFLLVLGIILLSAAVFRYQQVAHIAREASRWASVRGEQYATERNTTAATPADVYANAILPHAVGMHPSELSYSVEWTTDKRPTRSVLEIDPATGREVVKTLNNTVSVTVTYEWNTGLFGVIPVSSTSVNTIAY